MWSIGILALAFVDIYWDLAFTPQSGKHGVLGVYPWIRI
jgi:hypothetical protein